MRILKSVNHLNRLLDGYVQAKEFVLVCGFGDEIDWQTGLEVNSLGEDDLLRETAWVILSSGMRETVVRRIFPEVTDAFFAWTSTRQIVAYSRVCRSNALLAFGHEGKIDAIIDLANRIHTTGFDEIRKQIIADGVLQLQTFAYIGPVTCFHLAKNLGIKTAKPDRHLSRIATISGFDSPHKLCKAISAITGDDVSVVDLVLWRFAILEKNYQEWFAKRLAII